MTKYLVFFVLIIINLNISNAQTNLEYSYDANGNRITRQVLTLKSMTNQDNQNNQATEIIDDIFIKVFPNPTEDFLHIQIEQSKEEIDVTIYVYDTFGKLLLNEEFVGTSHSIDFSPFSIGSYILKLSIDNQSKEFVIIKEN